MSKDNNSVVKSAPIDPTPEMIAAGHEIINHRNFSPLLKRKLQARGLGIVEIYKAMIAAAPHEFNINPS